MRRFCLFWTILRRSTRLTTLLLQRLSADYSITGTVLQWFESYLQDRAQRVIINGTCSVPSALSCGVPQGSVVGPLLFLLYTGPLAKIITSHQGVNYAMYADDTQIYLTMSPRGNIDAVNSLKDCLEDIKVWSNNNRLRLNERKSELIHFSSHFRSTEPLPDFATEGGIMQTSEYVRDLGVTLDQHLTLQKHIKNVCKSASWGIYRIGKLRRLLDKASTEKLVHAFVSSHLDYCNSLLAGLPISYLSPLQRIQNTAARMVTFTRKHDHISPILCSLHWLPFNSRITFKILLIVYKITHNLAPQYLQDLVSLRFSSSARPLRSSFSMQIIHGPRTKTRYGDRAFSCIAPTLWNKLPPHIQNAPSIDSFKTLLKTRLFTL